MRYVLFIFAVLLCSCQSDKRDAEKLLEEVQVMMDNGDYRSAIRGIDSLRRTYPKAIEVRKAALPIYQEASLRLAQENLAKVDSALQASESLYNVQKQIVDDHHAKGIATQEELHELNLLRYRRDSLKGVFDMECDKIKYIHKKQGES